MWGRKRLQYVSDETACGSVSFPRWRGKAGMGDNAHNLDNAADSIKGRKGLQ
jgi:hypothetical protein